MGTVLRLLAVFVCAQLSGLVRSTAGARPVFADDADWAALPKRIAADPVLARIADATRERVARHLSEPVVEHRIEGVRRLTSARLFLRRVLDLATVARLDDDKRAAERAREEMRLVAALPDWGPAHFLDVAEYSLGMATGLAWLRAALPPGEADYFEKILVEKSLRPSFEASPFELRWIGGRSNWTQVCHAGLVAAALAVADREPELASRVIARAVADQAGPASAYAPDGAYAEGPIYWGYGTTFHVVLISLLEKAEGSDRGLADFPGFLPSADYLSQMVAPGGRFFNYADSREQVPALPVLHWFAARRDQPDIAAIELRRLESGSWTNSSSLRAVYERTDALALWWRRPPAAAGAGRELPLRWLGRGENPVAVARTAWRDPEAAFLGIKGGSAATSHAHRDAGSFVYEAGGVRWALDPGMQDYHSLESTGLRLWDGSAGGDRWRVFRLGLEGHNVLRFDGAATDVAAHAGLREREGAFEVDLSPLHAPTLRDVTRRAALAPDGALAIDDRWVVGETPAVARWQWLTRAEVEPLPDGARLRQDGRALRLRVASSEPASWTLVVEEAGDLLAPHDEPCLGMRRLTIRVATPPRTAAHLRVEARLEQAAGSR